MWIEILLTKCHQLVVSRKTGAEIVGQLILLPLSETVQCAQDGHDKNKQKTSPLKFRVELWNIFGGWIDG